jgi:hypothetical protein
VTPPRTTSIIACVSGAPTPTTLSIDHHPRPTRAPNEPNGMPRVLAANPPTRDTTRGTSGRGASVVTRPKLESSRVCGFGLWIARVTRSVSDECGADDSRADESCNRESGPGLGRGPSTVVA